jgi:hypothetical protein
MLWISYHPMPRYSVHCHYSSGTGLPTNQFGQCNLSNRLPRRVAHLSNLRGNQEVERAGLGRWSECVQLPSDVFGLVAIESTSLFKSGLRRAGCRAHRNNSYTNSYVVSGYELVYTPLAREVRYRNNEPRGPAAIPYTCYRKLTAAVQALRSKWAAS